MTVETRLPYHRRTCPLAPRRSRYARCPYALRSQSDRLHAHRRDAHGPLQLAVGTAHGGQVHPADRRHRPATQHRRGAWADSGRFPLAGPRIGTKGPKSAGRMRRTFSRSAARFTKRPPSGCSTTKRRIATSKRRRKSSAEREAAEREKRPYINSRRSLELSDAEVPTLVAEGRPHVVAVSRAAGPEAAARRRRPRPRRMGHVAVARPGHSCGRDGTPLYNFATVIDDAAMAISHVIRAEEHLSNTPIQILLHQALGNTLPSLRPHPVRDGSRHDEETQQSRYQKVPRESASSRRCSRRPTRSFRRSAWRSSETLDPVMVEYYEKIGFLPARRPECTGPPWLVARRSHGEHVPGDDRRELHARPRS